MLGKVTVLVVGFFLYFYLFARVGMAEGGEEFLLYKIRGDRKRVFGCMIAGCMGAGLAVCFLWKDSVSWFVGLDHYCIVMMLFAIGCYDWRRKRIPYEYLVPLLLLVLLSSFARRNVSQDEFLLPQSGILLRGIGSFGFPFGWYLLGSGITSVPLLLIGMGRPGSVGGGDIRLLMIMGWYLGPIKILLGFCIGILLAAMYVGGKVLQGKLDRKQTFPLGPFLAMGIGISILWGEELILLLL